MRRLSMYCRSKLECLVGHHRKKINGVKLRSAIRILLICSVGFFSTLSLAQPLAASKSKFVGNVISNGFNIRPSFSNYWNQVTAENAGKWGSVQGVPGGGYNWTQLDNIYNYAKSKGFPYKHHTLVWGNQQPSFLADLDSAAQYQEVENWIKATGERYTGAEFCEVVNEPLHAPPVYKDALGGDGETGWDWVIKSFELAIQYWSDSSKFLINEYNIINSSSATDDYLEIINLLKDRGLIDGIGIQCHNYEVSASPATLKSNLDKLAATGLPIYISEFDINEADDNTQLTRYKSVFPVLYEHPGVYGITLWGYVQYDIWQETAYLLDDRGAPRPAMEWLRTYLLSPFKPVLISPVFTTDESLSPTLLWHASDSANTYNVQVSLNRNFSSLLIDSTVNDTLLQLNDLTENTIYYWRVNASNAHGTSDYTPQVSFITEQSSSISESDEIPTECILKQNYPNPFNPVTSIDFQISSASQVSLKVFEILGREVETLVADYLSPGSYSVKFDGSNLSGGVYFYILTADHFTQVRKLMLLK